LYKCEVEEVLSGQLERPAPIEEGKALVYREFVGGFPSIVAGDSSSDQSLFDLVKCGGLCIWAGVEGQEYENFEKNEANKEKLYLLRVYNA
jgi:hypothetical protein